MNCSYLVRQPVILCNLNITSKIRKIKKKYCKMALLIGWRYKVFIGSIVGVIGLALYPIAIDPMINTEKYSE
jgi:hypothetical protein